MNSKITEMIMDYFPSSNFENLGFILLISFLHKTPKETFREILYEKNMTA